MRTLSVRPIVLAGIFLITLAACSQKETTDKDQHQEKTYPVKVRDIEKKTITRTLEYTANLTAFEKVYLAPASPGRIDQIYVDAGDRVSQGETLIQMDESQLVQAKSQLQSARSNFRRLDTLYQMGSIAEQKYEQAKTQYEVAKERVESLQENTTIQSPLSGLVTAKYYEAQEMYSGTPNTPAGKAAVVTLMQISPLKAFVDLPERYFPHIHKGMKANINIGVYPDTTFQGQVHRVHPTINRTTRTFQVELLVDNPQHLIRPGMFARVRLDMRDVEALVVPSIAVTKQEGTNNRYIFVNKNGKAQKIQVQIGKRFNDQLEVISDQLHPGMEMVMAGQANLLDGANINIKN